MSTAKQGNRGCPECRRSFPSNKALYGHMRCHPERSYRGINAPASAVGKCNSGDRSDYSVVASEMEAVVGLLSLGQWRDHSSDKKKVAKEKKKTKGRKLSMIIMDEEAAGLSGGESTHRKSTTRSSSPAKTTEVMDFVLNEVPTMEVGT